MNALTTSQPDPFIKVLRTAADIIDRNGWHRGDYYDRSQLDGNRSPADCPVCAVGAINLASGAQDPDEDALISAEVELVLGAFLGVDGIVPWNDDTATDQADVTTAMRDCADHLEAAAAAQ